MLKLLISLSLLFAFPSLLADGKILATSGVAQVEGAGGGGLVPWAMLGSYATEEEISGAAHCTEASIKDFDLSSCGVKVNLYDQLEVSFAKQSFDVNPLGLTLEQDILSAKYRLYGDIVYSDWPQVSFGLQYKQLTTPAVAYALGADNDEGIDYYISASKLHLGMVAGYNLLWNVTLRHTKANEIGLLGFGSETESASLQGEFSLVVLLQKNLAIGAEYRQKPDNLGLGETDWRDVFVAWFPNKHVSLTAAYIDLGTIAGLPKQTGWYLSVVGYF